MMLTSVYRLLTLTFGVTAGCGQRPDLAKDPPASGTPAAVDTASAAREIRRLSEEHAKAAVDRDTVRLGSIYAADVRYLPQNDSAGEGAELVRGLWRGLLKVPGLVVEYRPERITVAQSGDLAVERGTIKSTDNGKPDVVGHYVYVWQRRGRDGKWQVTDYLWNTRPLSK